MNPCVSPIKAAFFRPHQIIPRYEFQSATAKPTDSGDSRPCPAPPDEPAHCSPPRPRPPYPSPVLAKTLAASLLRFTFFPRAPASNRSKAPRLLMHSSMSTWRKSMLKWANIVCDGVSANYGNLFGFHGARLSRENCCQLTDGSTRLMLIVGAGRKQSLRSAPVKS